LLEGELSVVRGFLGLAYPCCGPFQHISVKLRRLNGCPSLLCFHLGSLERLPELVRVDALQLLLGLLGFELRLRPLQLIACLRDGFFDLFPVLVADELLFTISSRPGYSRWRNGIR